MFLFPVLVSISSQATCWIETYSTSYFSICLEIGSVTGYVVLQKRKKAKYMYQQIECNENHLNVTLSGKLYSQDTTELREEILKYIDNGVKWIHLNLAELTYMDSSGLSLLVLLHKSLQNVHGSLAIDCTKGLVQEILYRTRLNKWLTISLM